MNWCIYKNAVVCVMYLWAESKVSRVLLFSSLQQKSITLQEEKYQKGVCEYFPCLITRKRFIALQSELTASLGALWVQRAQNAPRKAVD